MREDSTDGLPERSDDLLAPTPETAYFWGRVAGDGELTAERLIVRASDETATNALAAIVGVDPNGTRSDQRVTARQSVHDASVVRYETERVLQIELSESFTERVTDVVGRPVTVSDAPEECRLDRFDAHRQQLVRGLLEACGTVCFRESSASVGISFVHEDNRLLETLRSLLDGIDPPVSTGELAESSSGGYWFGLADDADPAAFTRWVYDGSDDSGLYAGDRRRKLRRSVERATDSTVGSLSFSEE